MSRPSQTVMSTRALPSGLVLQGVQGSLDDPVLQEPRRVPSFSDEQIPDDDQFIDPDSEDDSTHD